MQARFAGLSFETTLRGLLRMSDQRRLRRAQPLVEHLDIDEPARVAAFAEFSRALEGLDLEADDAALDRENLRGGPHRRADEGCCKMADIDLGADRDPARLKRARIASPDVISISRIIIGVA